MIILFSFFGGSLGFGVLVIFNILRVVSIDGVLVVSCSVSSFNSGGVEGSASSKASCWGGIEVDGERKEEEEEGGGGVAGRGAESDLNLFNFLFVDIDDDCGGVGDCTMASRGCWSSCSMIDTLYYWSRYQISIYHIK